MLTADVGEWRLSASVGWRRRRLPLLGATEVVLGPIAASCAGEGEPLDAALRRGTATLLLALHRSSRGRSWHVLTLRAPEPCDGAVAAACVFALDHDFTCEVAPGAAGEVTIRIFAGGLRSRVARAAISLPTAGAIRGALRGGYHRLRVRAANAGRRPEMTLLALDLSTQTREVAPPAGVTFSEAAPRALLARPLRYGASPGDVEHWLAAGGRCFVATAGGSVIFRMWTRRAGARQLSALAARPAGSSAVLIHDCLTAPAHRGRGIYPAALCWLAAHQRSAGTACLLMEVSSANLPALRSARRAGFVSVRRA